MEVFRWYAFKHHRLWVILACQFGLKLHSRWIFFILYDILVLLCFGFICILKVIFWKKSYHVRLFLLSFKFLNFVLRFKNVACEWPSSTLIHYVKKSEVYIWKRKSLCMTSIRRQQLYVNAPYNVCLTWNKMTGILHDKCCVDDMNDKL